MTVQLNGSTLKAFAILDLFSADRTEITAGTVARILDMNAVTAHRFLRTLEHAGALVAVSKGVYRLGFLLADLGDRATHQTQLGGILQPALDSITRDLQEASMANVFQTDMVVCIARSLSGRSLAVDIRVGTQLDGYCTASGKVWLASFDEAALTRYFDVVPLARMTEHTEVDRTAVLQEIARVRAQKYATNINEREDGITSIAVPVTSQSGRMIVGLSVFGPSARLTEPVLDNALSRLRAAASEIRQAMYGKFIAPGETGRHNDPANVAPGVERPARPPAA